MKKPIRKKRLKLFILYNSNRSICNYWNTPVSDMRFVGIFATRAGAKEFIKKIKLKERYVDKFNIKEFITND